MSGDQQDAKIIVPDRMERSESREVQLSGTNPMQMLAAAVARGVDTDQLEKLLALQERWERNEARKAYTQAMAEFKRNPPVIEKDRQVDFTSERTGKRTTYKHATLDNATAIIGAALAAVGISAAWETQQEDSGLVAVTCILTHQMGHSERTTLKAKPDDSGGKNAIQSLGSAVAYLERYTLFAATGVAPKGIDNDGKEHEPRSIDATVKDGMLREIADVADRKHADALWARLSAELNKAGDIPAYEEVKKALQQRVKTFPKEAV